MSTLTKKGVVSKFGNLTDRHVFSCILDNWIGGNNSQSASKIAGQIGIDSADVMHSLRRLHDSGTLQVHGELGGVFEVDDIVLSIIVSQPCLPEQPAEPVDRMALGYEQVHLGLDQYRAFVEAHLNGDGTATGWYLLTITVFSPELCEEEKELVTRKEYELPQAAWLAFDRLIAETAQGLASIDGWVEHFDRLGGGSSTPIVGIAFEHMETMEAALSQGHVDGFGGRWDGDQDCLYIWKGEDGDSGYVKEDDGRILLIVAASGDDRFDSKAVLPPAHFAEIATERTPEASFHSSDSDLLGDVDGSEDAA